MSFKLTLRYTAMKSRAESSGRADDERQLKNSAPPAPHEWLALRASDYSSMVRRRRPSDAGPRKTPKILQEGGGELFGRNPGRS